MVPCRVLPVVCQHCGRSGDHPISCPVRRNCIRLSGFGRAVGQRGAAIAEPGCGSGAFSQTPNTGELDLSGDTTVARVVVAVCRCRGGHGDEMVALILQPAVWFLVCFGRWGFVDPSPGGPADHSLLPRRRTARGIRSPVCLAHATWLFAYPLSGQLGAWILLSPTFLVMVSLTAVASVIATRSDRELSFCGSVLQTKMTLGSTQTVRSKYCGNLFLWLSDNSLFLGKSIQIKARKKKTFTISLLKWRTNMSSAAATTPVRSKITERAVSVYGVTFSAHVGHLRSVVFCTERQNIQPYRLAGNGLGPTGLG